MYIRVNQHTKLLIGYEACLAIMKWFVIWRTPVVALDF